MVCIRQSEGIYEEEIMKSFKEAVACILVFVLVMLLFYDWPEKADTREKWEWMEETDGQSFCVAQAGRQFETGFFEYNRYWIIKEMCEHGVKELAGWTNRQCRLVYEQLDELYDSPNTNWDVLDTCRAIMDGRYDLVRGGYTVLDENGEESFAKVRGGNFMWAFDVLETELDIDFDAIIARNIESGYYIVNEDNPELEFFFYDWYYSDAIEILNRMRRVWDVWGYPCVWTMDGWEDYIVIDTLTVNLPENNDELYGMFPELKKYRDAEGYHARIFLHGDWNAESICKLLTENGKVIFFAAWEDENGEEHLIRDFEEFYEYYYGY